MSKRKKTDYIVVHSSLTPNSSKITSNTIDEWHRKRGWLKIGYHFVITTDGKIDLGRDMGDVGAHAKDNNAHTVSVCLIGGADKDGEIENNFNQAQMESLFYLLSVLTSIYKDAKVVGHDDLVSSTKCPSFDIKSWWDKHKNFLIWKGVQ